MFCLCLYATTYVYNREEFWRYSPWACTHIQVCHQLSMFLNHRQFYVCYGDSLHKWGSAAVLRAGLRDRMIGIWTFDSKPGNHWNIYNMPEKLREGIFLWTVNFGAFVNLSIHKSLITVPRPCLYCKFAIYFCERHYFFQICKFFFRVIFPAYGTLYINYNHNYIYIFIIIQSA